LPRTEERKGKEMPALRLKTFEVSDRALDSIAEELGLSGYELIEEMEQAAWSRFCILRKEAEESAREAAK